jgi:hypothetical protein
MKNPAMIIPEALQAIQTLHSYRRKRRRTVDDGRAYSPAREPDQRLRRLR